MTDERLRLSRRKTLLGLGTVGVAGAGVGARSVALLGDSEEVANNEIQAGELDLIVDYYTSTDQGEAGSDSQQGTIDGDGVTDDENGLITAEGDGDSTVDIYSGSSTPHTPRRSDRTVDPRRRPD